MATRLPWPLRGPPLQVMLTIEGLEMKVRSPLLLLLGATLLALGCDECTRPQVWPGFAWSELRQVRTCGWCSPTEVVVRSDGTVHAVMFRGYSGGDTLRANSRDLTAQERSKIAGLAAEFESFPISYPGQCVLDGTHFLVSLKRNSSRRTVHFCYGSQDVPADLAELAGELYLISKELLEF